MRLLRWAERLGQYQYTGEYRPGVENNIADLLLRCNSAPRKGLIKRKPVEEPKALDAQIVAIFVSSAFVEISQSELSAATKTDKIHEMVNRF